MSGLRKQFKPYPRYKPSGVEWIGEIPEGWEVRRYRQLARFQNGINFSADERGSGFLTLDVLNMYSDNLFAKTEDLYRVRKDSINNYILKNGDMLFVRSSLKLEGVGWNSLFIEIDEPVIYSGFIIRARTYKKNLNEKFLSYYLRSKLGRTEIIRNSNTVTITNLSQEKIGNVFIILPNLLEQQNIANFLDRETASIDNIVTKQRRLIELLKEKRAALITHAVTKGLDPHAKMKDSGVEWIGEIPEGWQVRRLKFSIEESLKYGANEPAEFDTEEWPRYLRITDFDDNGILRKDTFKSLPPEKAEPYNLKNGDILFARSGATIGKTFQFKEFNGKACFAGYLIKASPKKQLLNSDFLFLYTKSKTYEEWKKAIFIQSTIENIGANKYKEMLLILPPFEEQQTIVDFLSKEAKKIDTLISKIEKQIELLTEYKQSLITAAVTGKIDVREAI